MSGLGNILTVIGEDPLTRWLLLIMALRAGWSLFCWRRCPRVRGDETAAEETLEAIEAGRQALWRHSAQFLLLMLAGIGLAIAGLFSLAKAGEQGSIGLVMLVAGIYIFTTEPIRHQIADAEAQVRATGLCGLGEAHENAISILRGNHAYLVLVEVSATVLLGLAILALNDPMGMI